MLPHASSTVQMLYPTKEDFNSVIKRPAKNRVISILVTLGFLAAVFTTGYAGLSLYQDYQKAVAYEQQKATQEALKNQISSTAGFSVSAEDARSKAAQDNTVPSPVGVPADSPFAEEWNAKIAQWQDKEEDPSMPGQGGTPLALPFTWVSSTDSQGNPIQVPVIAPNVLAIPSVGLQVPLVHRGAFRNESGQLQMSLPQSAFAAISTDAAPLKASSGNTVIAGHVNYGGSLAPVAPMSLITKATAGTKVFISDASGKIYAFAVTAVEPNVPHAELAARKDFFSMSGPRLLKLVTCGGTTENGTYTHNVIVTAVPI